MIYEEDAKKERRNRNVVPYHFSGNKISLSKIGDIKVIVHRQIPDRFDIKTVSITKKADGYYVTLSLDDQTVPTFKPDFKADKIVGIDVGLIDFFVTSDNERIAAPKFLRQAEGKGTPKNKLSSNHRLVGTQQCCVPTDWIFFKLEVPKLKQANRLISRRLWLRHCKVSQLSDLGEPRIPVS